MENQFVPYELAVKLKELGFDEECCSYFTIYGNFSGDISNPRKYNSEFEKSGSYISAPLWQQVESFLRTKILFHIIFREDGWYWEVLHKGHFSKNGNFKTYEEAREACLEKLIKLCKKNTQSIQE